MVQHVLNRARSRSRHPRGILRLADVDSPPTFTFQKNTIVMTNTCQHHAAKNTCSYDSTLRRAVVNATGTHVDVMSLSGGYATGPIKRHTVMFMHVVARSKSNKIE